MALSYTICIDILIDVPYGKTPNFVDSCHKHIVHVWYPGPAEMVQLLRFWPDQFSRGKNEISFLQIVNTKQKF